MASNPPSHSMTEAERISNMEDVLECLIAAMHRELGTNYASELLDRLHGYK